MFLNIQNNIDFLYNQTLKYFKDDYLKQFHLKESIVARFIISKEIEDKFGINNYLPQISIDGKPIFDNKIYWSISHKENLVFTGINTDKIGIDIEIYKERDLSLLDNFDSEEYRILGQKSWYNFYVLWTAKESILKYNLGVLDNIKDIKLIKSEQIKENTSGINFSKKLFLKHNNELIQVFSGNNGEIFWSACF